MVGFTAYAWLLKNASAAKIATYSYVNPVIALFLGWLILNEPITFRTMTAIVVILAGVILIISDRKRSKSDSNKAQTLPANSVAQPTTVETETKNSLVDEPDPSVEQSTSA